MLRAELTVPEFFRCVTRSLLDVMPRPMAWVWRGWIPRGSLSLVLGEPGVGKSVYALQLAAMVTRGWSTVPISPGPIEADEAATMSPEETAGPQTGGTVVLFEAGDSAWILRSRLDAAGADAAKVVLVERNWREDSSEEVEEFLQPEPHRPAKPLSRFEKDRELRRDLESLEQHVVQLRHAGHDVSLVIIDPIESLLRDAIDKHRLARMLSELADNLNVAIVAVGTTSPTPRAYPGLRLDGKGIDALFKVSNTVVTVNRDPENEQQRIITPIKLNLSAAPAGLNFALADDGSISWSHAAAPVTEQDEQSATREPPQDSAPQSPAQLGSGRELSRTAKWLKQRLSDGGVAVSTVRSDAKAQRISKGTLRRAYDQLGCISQKSWGTENCWRLPELVSAEDTKIVEGSNAEIPDTASAWDASERADAVCSATVE